MATPAFLHELPHALGGDAQEKNPPQDAAIQGVRLILTRFGMKETPAANIAHAAQEVVIGREIVRHQVQDSLQGFGMEIQRPAKEVFLELLGRDTGMGTVSFAESGGHGGDERSP